MFTMGPGFFQAQSVITSTGPLLHFDGSNGDTTIVDSHGGSTWGVNGGAQLSTTQQKFGPTALFCNTGYVNTTNFGPAISGDFCVEGWAFSTGTPRGLFHTSPNGTANGIGLGRNGTVWELYHNGTVTQSAALTIPTGWFHWACYRSGTTLVVTINGVVVITTTDSSSLGGFVTMFVGTYFNSGFPWVGYIDEFRMTLGNAVYSTSGFTPPTSPFT